MHISFRIFRCLTTGVCFSICDKCAAFMYRDAHLCPPTKNNRCKIETFLQQLSDYTKTVKLLAFKVRLSRHCSITQLIGGTWKRVSFFFFIHYIFYYFFSVLLAVKQLTPKRGFSQKPISKTRDNRTKNCAWAIAK